MYSNLACVTFIFYLYSFFFHSPLEGLCCKQKYRANVIHHFIFVFFIYFFYHSSCRKDQLTVLNLKFGTQDFTDSGLLKIRRTLTGLSLWFWLLKCLRKNTFSLASSLPIFPISPLFSFRVTLPLTFRLLHTILLKRGPRLSNISTLEKKSLLWNNCQSTN